MSSIFDDKKLIEMLLKAAQQQGAQDYQNAVNNPQVSPEARANYNLAKKLLLGLRSKIITNPNDPEYVKKSSPVDYDGEKAPEIKPENLRTLGDLLTWAATNKVKWDGQRIAWDYTPPNDQGQGEAGEKPDIQNPWVFQSYQKDRDRDQFTRQAITRNYYANKDALLGFLTYLRDTKDAKENKVFEVMIGKVINQANQYLQPNEKIGPRPADKAAEQFKDGDIIDGFSSNILDIKKPYEGIEQGAPSFQVSQLRLTYGDIKDFGSLQNWVSGMRDSANPNVDPNSAEGDPCGIIHILYLRARYLSSQARYDRVRQNYSALAKVYLANITNFGRQFKKGDQPCAVTAPGIATQQPTQPGQQGQGGGLAAASPQILQQLSGLRPFNANYISFNEIRKFTKLYNTYANDADVTNLVQTIENHITNFNSYQSAKSDTFQMNNLDYKNFKFSLRNPASATLASDALYGVIYYAGQLYERLVISLQSIAQDAERGKYIDYRGMQQQVAPGGPQQTNLSDLNDLRQAVQRDWMSSK